MPGTKSNTITTHLDTSLIGMSSQTKHQEIAWEIFKNVDDGRRYSTIST